MWLLRKLNDVSGTTKYLISENNSYTIGRKHCDIILEDDASISRKHCTFHVAKLTEGVFTTNTLTRVCVVDENSKYGTFLKSDNAWVQLNGNERKNLTHGSIIKFGLMENIWRLEYKPITACASGIPAEQKKNLETMLLSIDGCLKNSWCKECSLVIVKEITLTVKVVLALINGIPIVTPDYIEKVAESVKKQTELPTYENYQPVIKESILDKSLVSLDSKNHRRELFKGKKFIVPTRKQLETLKDIIKCAGGSVELLSSTHAWEKLADDDVVVIQLPFNNSGIPTELIKSFKEITSFLKTSFDKRIVPESEIAQAVAYSSIEKFCNPKSTCFNLRIGERKQADLGPVIVEDTPTTTQEVKVSQPGVVFASATYVSQNSFQGNTELQRSPQTTKSAELQHPLARDIPVMTYHNNSTQQESQKSLSQRKRTHNSDRDHHEIQNKRWKNPKESEEGSSRALKESSAENKGKGSSSKAAEGKLSCVIDDFPTRNELSFENIRVTRQSSRDFWDYAMTHKRKVSTESSDLGEDSNRKKVKLLEGLNSKGKTPEIQGSEDVVEPVQQSISCEGGSLPSGRKVQGVEDENDFTDYFGKEAPDADTDVYDLNNTIVSLTIISPSFLNEDGSLIDPPEVPVNAKRFKKQKIFSVSAVNPVEDEELSEGEWLEPHSNRLNVSMFDEKES